MTTSWHTLQDKALTEYRKQLRTLELPATTQDEAGVTMVCSILFTSLSDSDVAALIQDKSSLVRQMVSIQYVAETTIKACVHRLCERQLVDYVLNMVAHANDNWVCERCTCRNVKTDTCKDCWKVRA